MLENTLIVTTMTVIVYFYVQQSSKCFLIWRPLRKEGRRMKKLTVVYAGWGERFPLAQLPDDGRNLLFQYTPEALGPELSPDP
jgi:serine/threonine-protein kinase HipA